MPVEQAVVAVDPLFRSAAATHGAGTIAVVLFHDGDELTHFRCRTGHAYSPESLLDLQTGNVDDALWAAIRSLQGRADLARRRSERAHQEAVAKRSLSQAEDATAQAELIRELVTRRAATADQ